MSDDLLTRLRGYNPHDATARALMDEAAAEIERLLALWTDQTAARVRAEEELRKADAETLHRAQIDAEDMHRIQGAYEQLYDRLIEVERDLAAAEQRAETAERELERVRAELAAQNA